MHILFRKNGVTNPPQITSQWLGAWALGDCVFIALFLDCNLQNPMPLYQANWRWQIRGSKAGIAQRV